MREIGVYSFSDCCLIARIAALLLCLPALSPAQTSAPVPSTMNFQGRLAKPDGAPVPYTTTQSLLFALYDAPTGGNLLWVQNSGSIAVYNGVFAAKLDFSTGYPAGKSFAGTFANPLVTPYLQIQVGTNPPLSPRQPLAATAFAFTASIALTVPLGSLTAASFAGGVLVPGGSAGGDLMGTYPNPTAAAGAINSGKLAFDFLSLAKVSGALLTFTPAGQVIDQSVSVPDETVTGQFTYSQSFTPGSSGVLVGLDLGLFLNGGANYANGTLAVYSGDLGSTTLLTSQPIVVVGVLSNFQHIDLVSPVAMTAGQKYT